MRKTLLAPNEFRLTSLGLLNCRMKNFYDLALHVLYLSPGASDAAAGGPQANLSTLLGRSANSNAVVPIYTVTNFKQGNVIPSAPLPTGPSSSANSGYSPLWQVNTVTWKSSVTPYLLKSSDDVQAALADGKVTIAKTNIVVNCPVIYTPLGGLLQGVSVTSSVNWSGPVQPAESEFLGYTEQIPKVREHARTRWSELTTDWIGARGLRERVTKRPAPMDFQIDAHRNV